MRRNYTFWKFRIKEKNLNLNFIETFDKIEKKETKNNKITRVNSLFDKKIKIIPSLKISNSKNINTDINNNNNTNNVHVNDNLTKEKNNDLPNIFSTPKKKSTLKIMNNNINNVVIKGKKQDGNNNNNNNNNSTQKKKIKFAIPINKSQAKPLQNLNQNYVININNNINNSYQIKMQNGDNNNPHKINDKNSNYDFAKMKIVPTEEGNKNCNTSNQKTVLTEISDISCFKSNQKVFNLNSINSFVNNDNDFLSFSDDTNLANNIKYNFQPETKGILKNSNYRHKKKIYINPDDFNAFCKEIEEKLIY